MCINSFFVTATEVAIMRRLRFEGHTVASIANITRRSAPTVMKWTSTHAVGRGRYYDPAYARNLIRTADSNRRPISAIVPKVTPVANVEERVKVSRKVLNHFAEGINAMHAAYDALKAG